MGSELGLDGKIAIVTGGNRGIGRSISQRLAAVGAVTIVLDIEADKKFRKDLKRVSPRSEVYMSDIRNPDSLKLARDNILDVYKGVDILVNKVEGI